MAARASPALRAGANRGADRWRFTVGVVDGDPTRADPVMRRGCEARVVGQRHVTVRLVKLLELSRRVDHSERFSSTIPTTNHRTGLFASATYSRAPLPSLSMITVSPAPAPNLS